MGGLNYRTGVVKFYDREISNTLLKMYNPESGKDMHYTAGEAWAAAESEETKMTLIDGPTTSEKRRASTSERWTVSTPNRARTSTQTDGGAPAPRTSETEEVPPPDAPWKFALAGKDTYSRGKVCQISDKLSDTVKNMECVPGEAANNDVFWEEVNIAKIRRTNEKLYFGYLMTQYGIPFQFGNFEKIAKIVANGKTNIGEKRKKRSAVPIEKQNVTRHALEIIDEDSSSNFKVKDCRIWEESEEGEVIETHVYDFERDVLIEDSNLGGSSLNATFFEDGVEKDADEVSPPEEEQIETISIVLRPRGN